VCSTAAPLSLRQVTSSGHGTGANAPDEYYLSSPPIESPGLDGAVSSFVSSYMRSHTDTYMRLATRWSAIALINAMHGLGAPHSTRRGAVRTTSANQKASSERCARRLGQGSATVLRRVREARHSRAVTCTWMP